MRALIDALASLVAWQACEGLGQAFTVRLVLRLVYS